MENIDFVRRFDGQFMLCEEYGYQYKMTLKLGKGMDDYYLVGEIEIKQNMLTRGNTTTMFELFFRVVLKQLEHIK